MAPCPWFGFMHTTWCWAPVLGMSAGVRACSRLHVYIVVWQSVCGTTASRAKWRQRRRRLLAEGKGVSQAHPDAS